MKILVYGFGPYDRFEENITQKIIHALPKSKGVVTKVFDVEFDREMFLTEFERVKPDIILGLGQHPRARKLRIERKARNLWAKRGMESPKAIVARGRDLAMSLKLPATPETVVTYDAGTYVCNYSMFWSEQYAMEHEAKAAFLHVPRSMTARSRVRQISRIVKGLLAS